MERSSCQRASRFLWQLRRFPLTCGRSCGVITAAESENTCETCGAKLLTASGSVNGDAVDMENGNAIVPLTVINNPGFDLPKAGGYGTWMFTVGGCMLLGVAAFIVIRGRKHNKNDQ